MFEEKGHWFPGAFAFHCTRCGDCLPRCPEKLPIPDLLFETHKELFDRKAYLKQKIIQILRKIYLFFFKGA
jgi:predicted aldo/keto reductase-like oxidoreductase